MEILLPAMHSWLVCNHYDHGVDDDSDDDVVDDEVDDDRDNDIDDHLSQQSDVTRILHGAHSQLLPEKKMKKIICGKNSSCGDNSNCGIKSWDTCSQEGDSFCLLATGH